MIKIDSTSNQPKYKQIVSGITGAVEQNILKRGQQAPSINQLCEEFSLSRETALNAYKELKSRGIISSSPGKGYYIATDTIKPDHKIFLLFDELNAFKEILYNSLKENLADKGIVDIYFHHYNSKVFDSLIRDNMGNYTSYVIMPIPLPESKATLKVIPDDKVFILDVGKDIFGKQYASVCQDFKEDVIYGLYQSLSLIKKYKKLVLVFPDVIQNPKDIVSGFKTFCSDNGIAFEIIGSLSKRRVKRGEAYFVIDDRDLVFLVKESRIKKLRLGADLGIISYNDTPLKEVVADGITSISTDFRQMGKSVVEMILTKKRDQLHNPSTLIKRASL